MISIENFKVVPSGVIKDGQASVTVDSNSGSVSYTASVKYGVAFFSSTYVVPPGTYSVPPADLLSSVIKSVGQVLAFGPVTLTVESISAKSCVVDMVINGQGATGKATLDTSQQLLQVISGSFQGKVLGMNVNVNIVRL